MKFLHSMIRTMNEKEMVKFYCELIGLKSGKRIRLEDCYLQYLTDDITGTEIELTKNDDYRDYIKGNQFGHFAFGCKNIDEIGQKIKEMGYQWKIEPFYLKEVDTKIAFIEDPDGNEIEFIEEK